MAKKYPYSGQRFNKIKPDAAPTTSQNQYFSNLVGNAVNIIDSPTGPPDPANPANPLYPGWVRMTIQERIMGVIEAVEKDPNMGGNATKIQKAIEDAYSEKHRRR